MQTHYQQGRIVPARKILDTIASAKVARSAIARKASVQALAKQLQSSLAEAIQTAVLSYSREAVIQLQTDCNQAECLAALSIVKAYLDKIGLTVANFAVMSEKDQTRFYLIFASDL